MGRVVDLGKRLLRSYVRSEALQRSEKYKAHLRITKCLRDAVKRGVHDDHQLQIVALLELISMGYSVEWVEVSTVYSIKKEVTLFFRASVYDTRRGRVIELQ